MGIFAVASLLGGIAWSGGSLIGFRVLQGVGAALIWPSMIGMACAAVGDSNRAFALGLIFGTCSLGNAAGPVVGGALTQWFSWRWVLWINVPLAVGAFLLTIWSVARDPKTGAEKPRNDYAGMIALTGGLVALMLVVYQVQSWGWTDPRTIGFIALALVLLGGFPFLEKRVRDPLIPMDMMQSRELQTLCFAVLVICQLFFIVLLYYTQYAMKFLGDDPMAAGLRVVTFMLSYGVVSYFGGPLSTWLGTQRLLIVGLVSAAVASIMLGVSGPGASWLPYNSLLLLLGIGVGAVIPTVSARAIETVGTDKASLVSGIIFMCQLAGAALMLAVNTAIFTAISSRHLDQLLTRNHVNLSGAEKTLLEEVITGAQNIKIFEASQPGIANLADMTQIANQAYLSGLQVVMWFSAAVIILSLLLVLRYVPGRHPPQVEVKSQG